MPHHPFRALAVGAGLLSLLALAGCEEKIDDSARYVYKTRTVMDYLESHPAYSDYAALLRQVPISPVSQSTVGQLLSARGHYTVFAPTNEAIAAYLQTLVDEGLCTEPSWDAFVTEEKADSVRRAVVMNSVIDGADENDAVFTVSDFPSVSRAEFPLRNLNDKRLSVRYTDTPDSVYINTDCPLSMTERDIHALNGVIHQVGKVIAPKDVSARSYILDRLRDGSGAFLCMFRAIQACGLLDTLGAVRDEVYEQLYLSGRIPDLKDVGSHGFSNGGDGHAPRHRLYGFTLFAEPDDFWRSEGLDPQDPDLLEKLTRWIQDNHQYSDDDRFTTDADYASPDHLLHQWVTYHLLPERLPADKLVIHACELGYNLNTPYKYTIPVYDLLTTMGRRRLMKLYQSAATDGVYLNRFARADDGRLGTGMETGCDPDKVGARVGADSPQAVLNDIVNCCIYPIDAPISYNDRVRNNLQKQRLRFDAMSLFPECMNNDIRRKESTAESDKQVLMPNTLTEYDYFRDFRSNVEEMNTIYFTWWGSPWTNLNVDEIKSVGYYDATITLPPVPRRGTYEFRYKVLPDVRRGVVQVYLGTDPDRLPVTGLPVDLGMSASDPRTGWQADTGDDDYDAEVDKGMRNNGFMKGALSVTHGGGFGGGGLRSESERLSGGSLRYILWRGTMDPDKTYYLRVKNVLDSDKRELYMDYFELCAKEVYDNPDTPEDPW